MRQHFPIRANFGYRSVSSGRRCELNSQKFCDVSLPGLFLCRPTLTKSGVFEEHMSPTVALIAVLQPPKYDFKKRQTEACTDG